MTDHQFSKHFQPDADKEFKDTEFEKAIAEYFSGFVEAYPHLITKKVEKGVEVWIFKFAV